MGKLVVVGSCGPGCCEPSPHELTLVFSFLDHDHFSGINTIINKTSVSKSPPATILQKRQASTRQQRLVSPRRRCEMHTHGEVSETHKTAEAQDQEPFNRLPRLASEAPLLLGDIKQDGSRTTSRTSSTIYPADASGNTRGTKHQQ